jgi:hypothetical protein
VAKESPPPANSVSRGNPFSGTYRVRRNESFSRLRIFVHRALAAGDRVKMGDVVGAVPETRLQVTHLRSTYTEGSLATARAAASATS